MTMSEHASLKTAIGEDLHFLGARMEADLRGLMLEARVEQRFINKTRKSVEAIYTFPLPWGAVLMGVEVDLGGKKLVGAVVEKKTAEACYEEALSDGNAAIMLERNVDESYTLNLGNLNAGETCTICLQYAQTLQFEQQALRLLIPTVIAPRYGDPVQEGGLAPHQVPVYSGIVEHPFDLTLRLHGSLAKCRVASPSHPIGMQVDHGHGSPVLTVTMARSGFMDRDFVLVVDQLEQTSMAVVAKDLVRSDRTALLASFCPQIKIAEPKATAVKILVDCSGSMSGDSIDAAKRALQAIVLQLTPGDRFSLSRFGSNVEHRARGMWKATETSRLAAQRWVGKLEADLGGTEMAGALMSTFAIAQTTNSDVLMVTDGEISGIDSTITMAQRSGHRVFIVGIGSSPAESHLRRLAAATGGACDFVAPGEAVEPAVLRMFARLRSPQVTNLRLEWSDGTSPEWVTPLSTAVFDGDTVNIYAFVAARPSGEVRLVGNQDRREEPLTFGSVELPVVVEDSTALSRMAAAAQVHLSDAETAGIGRAGSPFNRTDLAVAYQLVTRDTNFLLVHERAEHDKATEMPEQVQVAQMLPAGWGGVGTVAALSIRRATGISSGQDQQVCYSISRDPMAGLGTPSMWRRRDVGDRISESDVDNIEIPAFLRRDPDSLANSKMYHSSSEFYRGLTPLGLSDRLLIDQPYGWPDTYEELEEYLLDPIVVDWLRMIVAQCVPPGVTEQEIVHAFLYFMAQQSTYDGLLSGDGVLGAIGVKLKSALGLKRRRVKTADDHEGPINQIAFADMQTRLRGMTASEWPSEVLCLAVEG